MPAPMDALGAFSHLNENLPAWIARVTDLAAYTAAKHAEYTEAYKKYATTGKPRRRKNSSVCSIHTGDLLKKPDIAPDLFQETANQNPRKRRAEEAELDPGDVASASTRHNVIIHYDGHTQKSLEEMVRSIVTARNHIRRGKMSQLPSMGFRSGVLRGSGPPDAVLSSIRSARSRGPSGAGDPTSTFDLADKHLEVVHGLCESAAYQFLRLGNCRTELANIEEKFRVLLEMAGAEVQRLKEAQEQAPPSEPDAGQTSSGPKLPPSSGPELPSPIVEPPSKPSISPTGAAAPGTIEVDDSASPLSLEPSDLTAFRANRMKRTNRMAA